MRHNVLPGEYYAYALWEPRRKQAIDNYLYSNEASRLFKLLNRRTAADPIADKLAFYKMCQLNSLPTPNLLAVIASNGTVRGFDVEWPSKRDLFIKPTKGFAGHGTERLCWDSGFFESNLGHQVPHDHLERYLVDRALREKQDLMVQPALSDHSALRSKPGSGLSAARLVTGRSFNGSVSPIFGFIYFVGEGHITSQHGYVALFDVTTGKLTTQPQLLSRAAAQFGRSDFVNIRLPHWEDAVRYATHAHEMCSNYVFVGWDIAFTAAGPLLLEGNANWSADEYQSLSGNPLGQTAFAEILESHLRSSARCAKSQDRRMPPELPLPTPTP